MKHCCNGRQETSRERRSFLGGIWVLILSGAGALVGPRTALAKKKISIDLAKLPALKEVGGGVLVSLKKKKVLFIRVSDAKVAAIAPVCTHEKCAVLYNKKWGEIRCDCHGSSFTKTGKVKTGPADKDLPTYPCSLENGKVIVEI